MISSDFRKIAREKLSGKWSTAICMVLAYVLTFFLISVLQGFFPETGIISLIISIVVYVIEIPLGFGLVFAFFKLFHGEDVKIFNFLTLGFNNFKRAWGIAFSTFLKLIGPFILMIISYVFIAVSITMSATSVMIDSSLSAGSIFLIIIAFVLLIVSGIWMAVKSYYYLLAQFVAFDNPNLTPKECVEKSKELMTNRRGKLFCLQFSFIGWAILSSLTFGIGYLWLLPYMQMAMITFYDTFCNEQ